MKMTGAEIIIKLLEREGVDIIAGIPGGANLPMYDALGKSRQIRHILARHEQGAGFIAQGIARSTGTPAVCFATSGPGATNLFTAIADAKLDSVPIICITGQVPLSLIGTDAFQEVDTLTATMPLTKHNYLVKSASELLEIIPEAFKIATSGRPGPVLIDVPKDIQLQEATFESLPERGKRLPSPKPSANQLKHMADLINQSERPIFYLGGGVIHSGAESEIAEIAKMGNIPITTTLMGLGAIPKNHPLNLGMLGMHGETHTNWALEHCDLLIVAGARFDDRATGKLEQFCPEASVIHIDIDDCEINKLRQTDFAIQADCKDVFSAIGRWIHPRKRKKWAKLIQDLKTNHSVETHEPHLKTPASIIMKTAEIVGDDAIITTDVGQHQMWVAKYYPFQRGRHLLTSGGLGTMGFGIPAAIGAALANPDTPVVCFSGDGSALMNIQELATAVEENVNIKIILMNNQSLGLVRQQQSLFYEKRHFASRFSHRPDFVSIAKGFGMKASCVETDGYDQFADALREKGPAFIHAPIDMNKNVMPIVPPGAANKDMLVAI